jgi:gamma-glutamyltranspeptidase/glutathione hydrolase
VLHSRLSLAGLTPGGPGTLAPGLRPPHTLCPGLFVRDGVCRLAIATPGDHGQPQTLAQVAVELLDRGRDVQAAVEAPRIRHDEGLEVMHESRHDRRGLAALAARGYHLRDVGSWSRLMGGVNAVHCPDGELRMGAADPRRASYAAAE